MAAPLLLSIAARQSKTGKRPTLVRPIAGHRCNAGAFVEFDFAQRDPSAVRAVTGGSGKKEGGKVPAQTIATIWLNCMSDPLKIAKDAYVNQRTDTLHPGRFRGRSTMSDPA
jgi:hypothetical protein